MHVLISGATGFIGSSIGACVLERGGRVTCLARGENGPSRAREAIGRAARGFGFSLSTDDVQVLPHDLDALRERPSALKDVDAVWHCAAHMSFAPRKLREAIDTNVGGTLGFVRLVADATGGQARFYYMSTAYTGGVEAESIGEELHLSPHLVNPYFVSKWGAEMMLEKVSRLDGLPISVYRPTLVIGHAETGWYGGQSYGLYNFLDGVWAAYVAGGRDLRLDLWSETEHNYLPIDDLAYNAVAITETTENRTPFEVFLEEGTDNSNADRVAWISEGLDFPISFGSVRTPSDQAADLWVSINKPFNSPEAGVRPFPFVTGKIPALLGSRYRRHELDREIHLLLVRWYRENVLSGVERDVRTQGIVRFVRGAHRLGLQGMLPSKPAGGLVAKAVAKSLGII